MKEPMESVRNGKNEKEGYFDWDQMVTGHRKVLEPSVLPP